MSSVARVGDLDLQQTRNPKARKYVESESDVDSEDEWQNQDFFESSVFWNHEHQRQQGANGGQDSQALKEKRKKLMAGNSLANNYHVQR